MSGLLPRSTFTCARSVGLHDVQFDQHVGRARRGIALLVDLGPGRADRRARDDADRRLVEPLDRDVALVGRPPIAGAAIHFLLRDELRLAPMDGAAAVRGQRARRAAAERLHEQILVAHEADEAALRADHRVELAAGRVGQPRDLAVERRRDTGRRRAARGSTCRRAPSHRRRCPSCPPIRARSRCIFSASVSSAPLPTFFESTSIRSCAGRGVDAPTGRSRSFSSARGAQRRQQRAVGRQPQRARLRSRQVRIAEHARHRQVAGLGRLDRRRSGCGGRCAVRLGGVT